jgi:predicted nucleic acid-binding protein
LCHAPAAPDHVICRRDGISRAEAVRRAVAHHVRELGPAAADRAFGRLRLPDAVIWASARAESALLVTRDTRDFPGDDPGVRIPY